MRFPSSFLVLLAFCQSVSAQQRVRGYHGSWTASAGTQVFHGTWKGQALSRRANAARGTWAVVSQSGVVMMQGTWSAERQSGSWRGRFAATTRGRRFLGTWKADLGDADARTLEDMLQRAMTNDISGVWQAQSLYGSWFLGP